MRGGHPITRTGHWPPTLNLQLTPGSSDPPHPHPHPPQPHEVIEGSKELGDKGNASIHEPSLFLIFK